MKAILVYRTQEQLDQLKTAAISDGYKNESFILYNDNNVKHLSSINARYRILNNFVEQNPVAKIYVWDIALISRKYEFIASFVETLTSKGIPLVIPKFRLSSLNEDGSINLNFSMCLIVVGTITEKELQLRKERREERREKSK